MTIAARRRDARAEVVADPVAVASALDVVLDNAIKFAPRGSMVRGRRSHGGDAVAVRDEGPGMRADELRRAGDRFWRARRHQNVDGSGLGLAIARTLLEQSGGAAGAAAANARAASRRAYGSVVGGAKPARARPVQRDGGGLDRGAAVERGGGGDGAGDRAAALEEGRDDEPDERGDRASARATSRFGTASVDDLAREPVGPARDRRRAVDRDPPSPGEVERASNRSGTSRASSSTPGVGRPPDQKNAAIRPRRSAAADSSSPSPTACSERRREQARGDQPRARPRRPDRDPVAPRAATARRTRLEARARPGAGSRRRAAPARRSAARRPNGGPPSAASAAASAALKASVARPPAQQLQVLHRAAGGDDVDPQVRSASPRARAASAAGVGVVDALGARRRRSRPARAARPCAVVRRTRASATQAASRDDRQHPHDPSRHQPDAPATSNLPQIGSAAGRPAA